MKQTLNKHQFIDEFMKVRPDNFSYEGLLALYDYLIDWEENTGQELEFDPIAICCDFTEYRNLKELKENYPDIEDLQDLENKTIVIKIPNSKGFIIQDF